MTRGAESKQHSAQRESRKNNDKQRTKFLKITSILMIIGGIIAVIAGVIAILGVSALVALAGGQRGLVFSTPVPSL